MSQCVTFATVLISFAIMGRRQAAHSTSPEGRVFSAPFHRSSRPTSATLRLMLRVPSKKPSLVAGLAAVLVVVLSAVFLLSREPVRSPPTTAAETKPENALLAPPGGKPERIATGTQAIPDPTQLQPCTPTLVTPAWFDTVSSSEDPIDVYWRLMSDVSRRLAASSSAEHLHVAALLERDPANRLKLIARADPGSASDPLLLRDAVRFCQDAGEEQSCPLIEWEQRLVAVDGENSEAWIFVAANRFEAGEEQQALKALQRAATASESRTYLSESIELTELGLAAGSDMGFTGRAAAAFGIVAMAWPSPRSLINMCQEQSARSVDWAYACLSYGELVEKQAGTTMSTSLALSIQSIAFKALGETEKIADVEVRKKRFREALYTEGAALDEEAMQFVLSNPTLFSAYLAAISAEGEFIANKRIAAEAKQLLSQRPDLACKPPG